MNECIECFGEKALMKADDEKKGEKPDKIHRQK